jgi:hypothetical protein
MIRRSRAGIYRYKPMRTWSPSKALRRTRARIDDAKAALMDIGATWGGVEQGIVDDTDWLITQLDQALEKLVEYIDEKRATGEEVGL